MFGGYEVDFESSGLSREEIRKRRRKKERTQAMALLAAALLVVILLIGGGIFGIVKLVGGKAPKEEKPAVDAVATESVTETPQEGSQSEEPAAEAEQETDSDATEEESADTEETTEETADAEELSEETEEAPDSADPFGDDAANAQLEALVDEKIASLTLEDKVAGLFFVTPAQLMGVESEVKVMGSDFGEKISAYPVGGIVLDASNIGTEEDFSKFIMSLRGYILPGTFIGMEHEGGENSPLVQGGVTETVISPLSEIGESLGASGAYSAGISLGGELRQYAVNVDFAPNVDVSLKEGSVAEAEGFGVDMEETAQLGKNMVKGLSDQGIFTAVKHFPSYGDVTQDGDSGQVISQRTKEDLQGEYAPYIEAIDAGADFVMVSHVSLPRLRGDNRPASLSPEVITDIIRTEWEYDGIVMTDFMNKSCMYQKYTYAEAAVGAIEAGADMILCPKNFMKSYNGILDAVNAGTITEERINESLRRIYRVKLSDSLETTEN